MPFSSELYWLTLTAVFTSVLWVPHILQRVIELKPYAALSDPRRDVLTKAPWAQRAIKAHTNAVENLVVFGVLILILELSARHDASTAIVAQVYFWSRVAHYAVYVGGLPWLRTPCFLVGWACQIFIAYTILTF